MKTVLVTGGSGFIGKNLAKKLNGKYHLLFPTHNQLDLLDGKALKLYLKRHQPDVIIHTALVGGGKLGSYKKGNFSDNLKIFLNLTGNSSNFGKLLHIGSGAEYDKSKEISKVKETDFGKNIPTDYYGLFKYICTLIIEQSSNLYNLRVFGLFGQYEDWTQRFISNAVCRNLLGMPITISKDVFFDYVYIDDFVKIVEHFIENNPKYHTYNIGTGKAVNLYKIAQTINRLSNKKSEILISEKGFKNEYTCDNSRLLSEIKGMNFSTPANSISQLIGWYRKNLNSINPKLL